MSEARGLRNVRPKAGTFVLVALLVAMTGLFLGGRAQGWFEEKLDVQTWPVAFPVDSTLGLQEGAEVQILGNVVGSVTAVMLDEQSAPAAKSEVPLYFTMRVRGPLMKLVRRDSVVQIKRKFGVAGSAYVLITAGQGEPAKVGTKLSCVIAPDITATLEETLHNFNRPDSAVQQILANVATVTANLANGKGTVGRLLSDGATAQSVDGTLANIQNITAGLTRNEGTVGKLLNDSKTGAELAGAMSNAKESLENINKLLARAQSADINGFMEQLRQTLAQVDGTLKEVAATTAALRQQAKDLPTLLAQTQEMMRQATRMIEGAQKTWLLRDHVAAEGSSRLAPSDVTAP
jgi:phospholipid/cholesterol/gamma-HCH transport system substrate-binding protein